MFWALSLLQAQATSVEPWGLVPCQGHLFLCCWHHTANGSPGCDSVRFSLLALNSTIYTALKKKKKKKCFVLRWWICLHNSICGTKWKSQQDHRTTRIKLCISVSSTQNLNPSGFQTGKTAAALILNKQYIPYSVIQSSGWLPLPKWESCLSALYSHPFWL